MADNVTFTNTGTGAVPNSTSFRTRQNVSGQHFQIVDVAPAQLTPVSGGQYALSVGSSSPTTLTVPSTATHAWISVNSSANTIRWTRDGTAPTATVGHELVGGESMEIDNVSSFKMIAVTSSSTVQVSYHKYI